MGAVVGAIIGGTASATAGPAATIVGSAIGAWGGSEGEKALTGSGKKSGSGPMVAKITPPAKTIQPTGAIGNKERMESLRRRSVVARNLGALSLGKAGLLGA